MNSEWNTLSININFLLTMSRLGYGTEYDFINDKMDECLINNIISKEASEDEVWSKYNIKIENQEPLLMANKYSLSYSDSTSRTRCWDFDLKKVILPTGWSLSRGCGCGRDMNLSSFTINDDKDNVIKTLSFFSHNKIKPQSPLMNAMDMLESPIYDEMEDVPLDDDVLFDNKTNNS